MSAEPTHSSRTQGENSTTSHSFMDMVAREAETYAADHTSPMSALLEEIEQFTLTRTPYPSMLTGRVEGRLLQLAVQLSAARNIVDIGTFTGYSALAMAEALPPGGRVLTIDHDPEHAGIARDFFNRSPEKDKIDLRLGDALDILKTLPDGQTDLVFIDADKRDYIAYYEESMRILRNGGLILADNALWYGRVFNPQDEDSRAVAAFNDRVNADGRAEKLFLTIRDGIYLVRKRTSRKASASSTSSHIL